MSKYYELPSGRVLDTEDIMYVGLINEKWSLTGKVYEFKITWANRVSYALEYDNEKDCVVDRNHLKNILTKSDENCENNMIFS